MTYRERGVSVYTELQPLSEGSWFQRTEIRRCVLLLLGNESTRIPKAHRIAPTPPRFYFLFIITKHTARQPALLLLL